MKKFVFFVLSFGVLVGLVFYKPELGLFIQESTGSDIYLVADASSGEQSGANDQSDENNGENSTENSQEENIEVLPEGNNVIGLTYSSVSSDPEDLALHAGSIFIGELKSSKCSVNGNIMYNDIIFTVDDVYKGTSTKEISMYYYGGSLNTGDIEGGIIKDAGSKSATDSDDVNVVVDYTEDLVVGETYLVFANNNNGIVSPVCGNSSFFKVDGGKVTSLNALEPFEMNKGEFEKTYLE